MAGLTDRLKVIVFTGEQVRRAIWMLADGRGAAHLCAAADREVSALRAIVADRAWRDADADAAIARAEGHLEHLDDLLSRSAAHAAGRCSVIADRLALLEEWQGVGGSARAAVNVSQDLERAAEQAR